MSVRLGLTLSDDLSSQEALKFLMKPSDGQPAVAAAFPTMVYNDAGEVNLPFAWFWSYYQAME